jgi:hypothetical protein
VDQYCEEAGCWGGLNACGEFGTCNEGREHLWVNCWEAES